MLKNAKNLNFHYNYFEVYIENYIHVIYSLIEYTQTLRIVRLHSLLLLLHTYIYKIVKNSIKDCLISYNLNDYYNGHKPYINQTMTTYRSYKIIVLNQKGKK